MMELFLDVAITTLAMIAIGVIVGSGLLVAFKILMVVSSMLFPG